ncbi:MAG TPA: ribosomal RNA small subunit methyltransferase A [Treponema sp.]|nr:ribosomal RNA small subunit methyltransferase A [Treponema sp.]
MELNYNSAADLRAFLEREGLGMRKKYGQNFLINAAIRNQLADALEAEAGSAVWEIGPGLGAMTRLLLDRGLAVRAFEIDSGFIRALREIFSGDAGFTLVEGDAMKTWPSQSAAPLLLGNLPYNIAASLIGDMIEKGRLFQRMVVTVQKEVALRMTAAPGSADYSSFSVLCASAYTVKKLMLIKGTSFYPKPNVDSLGVRLDLRVDCHAFPAVFYPLIRGLFASRRKMIKNNLSAFLAARAGKNSPRLPDILAARALEESGLDGNERAENLGIDAFERLAKTIEDMRILA